MKILQVVNGEVVGEIPKDAKRLDRNGNTLTVWEKHDNVPPVVTPEQVAEDEAAAEEAATQERAEAAALRLTLDDMKNGVGNVVERLAQLEKVLYFIAVRYL